MADIHVGGQAVIEGVMMRSPHRVSTAVRKADGEIVVRNRDFVSFVKRYKLLGLPLIRGLVTFVEMLVISIGTLNYSAEVAMKEEEKSNPKKEKKSSDFWRSVYMALTVILAMALGIGIFFFLPLWFSEFLGVKREALTFNLIAGLVRVFLFVVYVWVLSRIGEFKRIFQYHGAEHKSIYTFEAGKELTVDNVKDFSTRHPRCGTSFILIVVVFAILVYSLSDTIYYLATGVPPTLPKRFLLHFSLLPFVAGVGYELLRASGKRQKSKVIRFLSAPGLWIQSITTNEPTLDQMEVALVALKNALNPAEKSEKTSSASANKESSN
ncbi:MAG: DUF1385 domain-containing protein [Candidatus Zixiibacteriota bacterium]